MKATIKILTAKKHFSNEDLDIMRRVMNVLRAHDLAVNLTIKEVLEHNYTIHKSRLKIV